MRPTSRYDDERAGSPHRLHRRFRDREPPLVEMAGASRDRPALAERSARIVRAKGRRRRGPDAGSDRRRLGRADPDRGLPVFKDADEGDEAEPARSWSYCLSGARRSSVC